MEMASSMERLWKWLVKEHDIFYILDNVLHHMIQPPDVIRSRGQYSFKRLPVLPKE